MLIENTVVINLILIYTFFTIYLKNRFILFMHILLISKYITNLI